MKRLGMIVVMAVALQAVQASAAEPPLLKKEKDIVSYGIGVDIARNFKKQEVDIDIDLLIRGIREGLAGERLLMPEKDLRKYLNVFQADLRKKMTLNRRAAADENKKKSAAFLAENKTREGVVALPSGLQYKVIKAGSGRKPGDADLVECNYRGTLLNGTEFDATEIGKTATLKISQLIAGWKEAMKLMPVGSTWKLFVPPQLAYGERGVGSEIGPNELLIFDVEIVSIK